MDPKEHPFPTTYKLHTPHQVDPSDLGQPTYFVSHAWNGAWVKLVETVESFLANAADTTWVTQGRVAETP